MSYYLFFNFRLLSAATTISMMVGSELLVDWLKHAFICHFNSLTLDNYKKNMVVLCAQWKEV